MSEMFDKYPQPKDYIPNNMFRCHCKCHKLEVMTGETSVHSFDIPFNVEEDCANYEIIYKLGVEEILIKKKDEIDVFTEYDGTSFLTCHISAEESRLFNSTILDTNVQIKFILLDESVLYSEIYQVKVMNSLDSAASSPDLK